MKIKKLSLWCCISIFGLAMNAQAGIITFESLAHNGAQVVDHGATYTENGFLFTNIATEIESGFPPSLATLGTEAYGFSGSTAMLNDNYEGTTVFTKLDGNAFSFNSIYLTELYPMGEAFDVIFNAQREDGSSVFQTLTLDGLLGRDKFVFGSDFSDVIAVSWAQGGYDFHQFDNVNVPEPMSMLLFGTGLLTLLGARKKGKKELI